MKLQHSNSLDQIKNTQKRKKQIQCIDFRRERESGRKTMGDENKKMGYFCSPLLKLVICFMVPLIVVSVFASSSSGRFFFSNNYHSTKLSGYKQNHDLVVSNKDLRSKIDGVLAEQVTKTDYSVPIQATHLAALMKNVTPNSTNVVVTPLNETHAFPTTRKLELEKKGDEITITDLDRLEAGLQRARALIKEAKYGNQTDDPEFNPVGPMYWNAIAFRRSYMEMERQFKVYVYEEGEPPLFHNGPCKSIYSTEGNFIHQMEIDSKFRTKNPDKAHVFFLPISGPEASFSVPYLAKNSIRVLCNANTSEGFKPEKDVSFPEINLQTGMIEGFLGGPSPSRRSILAFFAGGLHGPIRPILLEHWENKDDKDIKIYKYLPKDISYYDMLRNSKFCICPSGYEVASPRIVEAIYTGCVPVLISDHYVAPFSDVLNWKSFSVEVSVKDIPNLKTILSGISTRQYLRMYRRVLQVRRHFEVHSPPKHYDFFHMILHSVRLRRLNVRVGDHQEL